MSFKYFVSSKRKRAGDCAVRCIMAAENMYWAEAYNKLCNKGLEMMLMPNDIIVIEKVLKDYGYVVEKAPMVLKSDGKKRRNTVREFAKNNKKGTFILSLSGHIVCLKDGDWYDTWDCSDYKVFKVFRKVG